MIGFSLPALSLNMLVTAVFVVLPPLYAEHQGLGAAAVGLIFLAAKLVDMVAAPMWGIFMDSYKTRWGRRIPYLRFGVVPYVIAFVLIWFAPFDGVEQTNALLAYMIIVPFLWEGLGTVVSTAYPLRPSGSLMVIDVRVGGVVSTTTVREPGLDQLPAASRSSTSRVCEPSPSATGGVADV